MMGLLQKALETYESHRDYASERREGETMMAPVGHIITAANLEITLDRDGKFVDAEAVDKKEPKIIIPATESSAGRTSAPCAHPLCDQLGYLIPENEKKYRLYVDQLAAWRDSEYGHSKLTPILNYVKGGTILSDLSRCKLVKLNDKGMPENDKLLVRWRILGEAEEACWRDAELFDAFTAYYLASNTGESGFCMVSGVVGSIAAQHPKGVVSLNGNAKLISANDDSGFTYRGRFDKKEEALTVGYEASQKAHNALRWLVENQGVYFGGRAFLCWNPQGKIILNAYDPCMSIFFPEVKPDFEPEDYSEELRKALNSMKNKLEPEDGVVLAVFDAATTGRLSLTYYNEFSGHDFLQRLHNWDADCCWINKKQKGVPPALWRIVDCAFGTQRKEKLETDKRVMGQQMQRLIACRVERAAIGADIVKALTDRASRPQAYDRKIWEEILFTACAVIRKYRKDRFKEEWNMALEPERKDRSYQYGRLLAVMEKAERDTYQKDEQREPNALRLMTMYCRRPMQTAANLNQQLERAYFPRLKPGYRIRYKNIMGEIMEVLSAFPDEELNKPLDGSYLMGYYLQREAFYKTKNNETEENENGYSE